MDGENMRHPLPKYIVDALQRGRPILVDWDALAAQLPTEDEVRQIRLVEIAKHIEPDILTDISVLLDRFADQGSMRVQRVRKWIADIVALDRKGMR